VIVLDTNVISELMRSKPDPAVRAWVHSQHAKELYTTAITVAEVRYGIQRLPDGRRRQLLATAAEDVFEAFTVQVLAFDQRAAGLYATLVAERERSGRPMDGFDGQIAAICRACHAALATRNTPDFAATGLTLLNPWDPTPQTPRGYH
jgi:predicted nucleic acid-binding protein